MDRTVLYGRALDRKRKRLLDADATLKLIEKKAGADENQLAEITSGWGYDDERARGQIETLVVVEVVAREGLTEDTVRRAQRAQSLTRTFTVESYDPPTETPQRWTLYLRELKPGAIAR